MDKALIPEGLQRCPFPLFALWVLALVGVMAWGVYAGAVILLKGLNVTGLNDYFGFGLWITADLGVIALGAGAFFSGFLFYGLSRFFPTLKELKKIINLAVIVGFICYSGAMLVLLLDIGQPIRGWFGYWHANVHSMLTEVIFCITCYCIVLIVEYVPIILENRRLDAIPPLHSFGHSLHEIMALFALTGTFLSFFHQGSLGGMFGVLFGRPFAYRTGVLIWPWTFFLFILSAIASGPAFTALICRLLEKVARKTLVDRSVYELIGKLEGGLLLAYLVFKGMDTLYWAMDTAPQLGFRVTEFYQGPYGMWLLFLELGICGVLPAVLLLSPRLRQQNGWLFTAFALDCLGILVNRFVFTVQTLAVPVLPFERLEVYLPTWAEWAPTLAMLAYGAVIISLSYRYLPIFPQERALNPVRR
jgi:molybdopterin-containing oxidoreductase family membrane subunit